MIRNQSFCDKNIVALVNDKEPSWKKKNGAGKRDLEKEKWESENMQKEQQDKALNNDKHSITKTFSERLYKQRNPTL